MTDSRDETAGAASDPLTDAAPLGPAAESAEPPQHPPVPASGSVWRTSNYVRLWVGESLSQVGENLGTLAIPVIAVVMLHATSQEVGYLTAAQQLAFLLIGLPVGAWVDRMRKRRVMIAADGVRAAVLLTIPAAWAFGALHIWQLYAVAAVVGGATVFFDVTYQSIVPRLVKPDQVSSANSGLETSAQVARVGGPALSGFLLTFLKAPLLLVATAIGYVVSMVAVSTIRDDEPKHVPEAHASLVKEIGEGLRFVFTHDLLRRITINTGASNLASGLMTTLMPLFILRELGLPASVFGVVEGIGSAGGILGALAAGWFTKRLGEGPTIVWSSFLFTAGGAVFMLAAVWPGASIVLMIAGMFVFMFSVVLYNIAQVSFRQRLCPPRLLGRMNASIRFVVWGVTPISSAVAGVLGGWMGIVPTMWLGVALTLLATLIVVAFSPLRTLRKLPDRLPD
ncbi:MFS transporter [Gryllotalpicola ginsengisoli]|uniref:MFS transporter n=1 Tax=Gryllotalpicola ginsengisoli TaxID=444608 RepID=UPI0003B3CA73|nr:MFS transporter [Gryllotalpicola ginsengisoli]